MNNPFELLDARLSNIESLLLDLKHSANNLTPHPDKNDLLTIQQAGEFLHLSVPTLYLKVSKSEIPVCKLPGSRRLWFSKQELTEWIKTGRKQTIAEINAEVEQTLTNKNNKK